MKEHSQEENYNKSQEYLVNFSKSLSIPEKSKSIKNKESNLEFEKNLESVMIMKGPGMFLNEVLQKNPILTPKIEARDTFSEEGRVFYQKMELENLGIQSLGTGNSKNLARGN